MATPSNPRQGRLRASVIAPRTPSGQRRASFASGLPALRCHPQCDLSGTPKIGTYTTFSSRLISYRFGTTMASPNVISSDNAARIYGTSVIYAMKQVTCLAVALSINFVWTAYAGEIEFLERQPRGRVACFLALLQSSPCMVNCVRSLGRAPNSNASFKILTLISAFPHRLLALTFLLKGFRSHE